MKQLDEMFHLYNTLESFNTHKDLGVINPNSICFIVETSQIYTQGTFFGVSIKVFDELAKFVSDINDRLNNVEGVNDGDPDGTIGSLREVLKFLEGYSEDTNLKTIIDTLRTVLEIKITEGLNGKIDKDEKGYPGGVVPLNESGLISEQYLPSYVDDVLEFDDYDSLPSEGERGKIYVTLDNNLTYRWTGSTYVEVSKSLDIPVVRGTGIDSIAVNKDTNVASGNYSCAAGNATTASGTNSHAEGYNTTASGDMSHSEGRGTQAKGLASHVEGIQTVANNESEHAEGRYNVSNSDTISSIGNGEVGHRHNVFEAKKSGDILIADTHAEGEYYDKPMLNLQDELVDLNNKFIKEIDANGHEYVDLGLPSGTLWATCNVGASKPGDYGLFFSWGDNVGYTLEEGKQRTWNWVNYKYTANPEEKPSNKTVKISKYYKFLWSDEVEDGLPVRMYDIEDDIAHKVMGGDWELATIEQWTELRDNTKHTYISTTTKYGSRGLELTSLINGKVIFIPFSGKFESSYTSQNNNSNYWTKDYKWADTGHCVYLDSTHFSPSNIVVKCFGETSRAVINKQEKYLTKKEGFDLISENIYTINDIPGFIGHSTVFPTLMFPRIFPENCTINYRGVNGDILVMENGKIIETNMDLVITSTKSTSPYLKELTDVADGSPTLRVYTKSNNSSSYLSTTLALSTNKYKDLIIAGFSNITYFNGTNAFYEDTTLEFIDLKFFKGNVTNYTNAFRECITLKKIVLPDNIKSANTYGVFYGCVGLVEVENFPDELYGANNNLFAGCKHLEKINGKSEVKVTVTMTSDNPQHQWLLYNTSMKEADITFVLDFEKEPSINGHFGEAVGWSLTKRLKLTVTKTERTIKPNSTIYTWAPANYCIGLEDALFDFKDVEEGFTFQVPQLISSCTQCKKLTVYGAKIFSFKNTTVSAAFDPIGLVPPGNYKPNLKYMYLDFIGKCGSNNSTLRLDGARHWGEGGEHNRLSLVRTLVYNTEDLASQGLTQRIQLAKEVIDRLTDEEKAIIASKGYTLLEYVYNN